MRIKKKDIIENLELTKTIAGNDTEDIKKQLEPISSEIEKDIKPIVGDPESAKLIADKITSNAFKQSYEKEGSLTEIGDDVVSRGIEAGINPEVDPKDLSNDWNGQDGGPDYGDKKPRPTINTTSIGSADTNDTYLPFESVNDKMLESDDNLHSRIQALKVQIGRTKDPEKLASLKDWLGKMEKEELEASKDSKTNESVDKEISGGIEFSNNELTMHIINLSNQIASTDDPKELAFLKKWLDETKAKLEARKTNENVKPKMSKDQLIETVLANKKREVIKTFKVKDLRK